jgi:Histidine kinase-, DNA gyrase B-, and HSP90-like ATPase
MLLGSQPFPEELMKFIQNPPDASSLMTSARSFGNYDLPGAIADLIDNSIKAQSRNIKLSCFYNSGAPEVSVVDDGSHSYSVAPFLGDAVNASILVPVAEQQRPAATQHTGPIFPRLDAAASPNASISSTASSVDGG